jgi:hypothetical protein
MDLDAYRRSAETFISELTGAYYRHYAGLEAEYEIEPIYARHGWLFTLDAVARLREQVDAVPPGTDQQRRARMLLDFTVEGTIGQATKALDAELARREADLSIEIDGERIGFRESAVLQANEPRSEMRELVEQARLELTARELGPLYRELLELQHATAAELGYASYRAMCEQCKALDLDRLERQTDDFSAQTDSVYAPLLGPELQRSLGIGLGQLRRADIPRFFRAPDQDAWFPAQRLVPSLIETLRGLGIEASQQRGVTLDIEHRPRKSPRAFCAPVRVPGEIYLVLAPVGGRDDYSVLFHESGHTEHFAHVDPSLPFEFRYLGDNAITEAYAFLLQHLAENPHWLARHLGIGDPSQIVTHGRAQRLIYLRRYAAKLAYELELHGPQRDLDELPRRYAQLLGAALQIDWPQQTFLADVDPGFYSACYLRAWALEAHLRHHLEQSFGPIWFEQPEAGQLLKALWNHGQRLTAEELLQELTGEPLDFSVMLRDLQLANHNPA